MSAVVPAPPATTRGADDDDEDIVFNVEDIQKICRDTIELCLGGNTYSHSRTPQWITVITEKTLARLNKLNKPFKYILCASSPSRTLNVKQLSCVETEGISFYFLTMLNERDIRPRKKVHFHSTHIGLVRITVTQKNGAGLHTAAAYFWDINTDGSCTVRWENKYMYCIINVWGLALQL